MLLTSWWRQTRWMLGIRVEYLLVFGTFEKLWAFRRALKAALIGRKVSESKNYLIARHSDLSLTTKGWEKKLFLLSGVQRTTLIRLSSALHQRLCNDKSVDSFCIPTFYIRSFPFIRTVHSSISFFLSENEKYNQ